MGNFYDKLRQAYWRMWHQITNKIRRWRESTGKNLAQGNVIKAGTYAYKTQEPETPKVPEENDLPKTEVEQPKIEPEERMSDEEAWRLAGELLKEQTKQARVDRSTNQESGKGEER